MKKRNESPRGARPPRPSSPDRERKSSPRSDSDRPYRGDGPRARFEDGDRERGFKPQRKVTEKLFNKPTLKKSQLERLAFDSARGKNPFRDERGPRGDARRSDARRDDTRPGGGYRPRREEERSDRPDRRFDRDEHGPRGEDRHSDFRRDNDRRSDARRGDGYRPRREEERSDRPDRRFDRDEHSPRDDARRGDFRRDDARPGGGYRPRREEERSDRPDRRFDRDERGPRSDARRDDARARSEYRPRREEERSDRPDRRFDRDERGPRSDARRDDARRSDARPGGGYRPRREEERSDRPDRRFDRDERGPRRSDARHEAPRPERDRGSRSTDKENGNEAESRRVGRFSRPPRYDFSDYEDPKPRFKKHTDDDVLRLNRYIANAGICSRREADELIESGQITVNGTVVTEMGYKVKRSDVIKYGKKILNPERMVYLLINKPKDYITTTDDPEERKTVMDLVAGACEERIYPVGRLDRNTTGLLLLTNDGELAEKLTHPSSNIHKIYQAELDKPITTEDFEAIQAGFELEDGFIKPDDIGIVTPDAMVVGLEIHSGKNRIVRRMFEHFGYEVKKLDRTVFAGLNKKDLPRGKWRFLTEKEVIKLKFLI